MRGLHLNTMIQVAKNSPVIGAFDGSNNWMSGWTNFDPQNTKY